MCVRLGHNRLLPSDLGSRDDVDDKPKHILQLRSKVRPKSLYFILFLQNKLRCRQRHNRDHKEQQKMLVQMFCHTGTLSIRTENSNIIIHFLTAESHVSWGFPTDILLRGHGPSRSVHPRPPSPPGAAGPRNRCLRRLPSAAVCGLGSHGPRPSRRQNPTERRGENSEKIPGTSKVKVFGNCGHSIFSVDLTNTAVLRCLEVSWKSRVNHGGSPNDLVPSFPFQFAWAR